MENEYRNSPDCPVKDILYLIQQDDIDHIRSALLKIIDESYPDGEIYLYHQGYSLYDSKDRNFTPTLLACLSGKEDCKKKSENILLSSESETIQLDGFKNLPSDNHVQVFTVENERSNRGLLITINKKLIKDKYINTLISAYNSQIQLLRNKDSDSLTGLYNRQSFDSKLSKIHAHLDLENRTQDNSSGYVFALLDIDLFKSINDNFGHVYGDEVLILFANAMRRTFREVDMLFRYGGEEFAVLLNSVNLEQAESILDRFRHNIENITLPLGNSVTVSIGYCDFTNKKPLTSITEQADKALYYSKENGRNKISCYETLLNNNKIQDLVIDEGDVELF